MKDLPPGFLNRATVAAALALGLLSPHPPALAEDPGSAASQASPAKDVADMDLAELAAVRVSPFDVSTSKDSGYRASNSVSASRFDAPIRDLPFAIQAFTGSFIEDQKPVNVFDVARYSPGVTYRSNDFNEGNANLAIRGFAVSSSPGAVQILRDGFHGPSILDLTNVSRVEVVKGPASFLYGQVAPGGIVNVITKSPRPEFATTARATVGSYGRYRFDGDVTGPASRTLFYRLATSYDQDSHYWRPYDARSWDLAPSLLWQPIPRVSLSLKYERFRKVEEPQLMQKPGYSTQAGLVPTASDPNRSGVDVPGLPDTWNSVSYPDFRRSDTEAVSAWIDLRADDHWNVRTAFSHLTYDVDAVATGNFGMANNQTLLQGRRVRGQRYTNLDDTLEAQAVGKYDFGGVSLRMLLGAEHVERRFDNWAAQAPNDPALGNDPTASPLPLWNLADPSTWDRTATVPRSSLTANPTNQTTRSVDESVSGGATFGFFNDRLLALAGWRETWTESQLADHLTHVTARRITARAVTPQYGVLWKVGGGLSAFASYAESFVPGTQLLTNPDETLSPGKPTRGQGYDAGLKADLLGGRLSGTLTAFEVRNRNIVNDLATTASTGNLVLYSVQSGEQRSRGVELDATAVLAAGWQLYLSYSYMEARIVEFSGHDEAILAEDPGTLDAAGQANYKNVKRFHGAPLQMSAPHLANLWTRYDLAEGPLAGLYLGGGVNYVYDQTLLSDTPTSAHQTYALVNALVGYSGTAHGVRMSVDLMGKNLAGAHYRPSQSTRGRPLELLLTLKAEL